MFFFSSYLPQTVCRQTSRLRQGCRRGSGRAWTPASAPRRRTGGGWRSGRRRPGGRRGWCIQLPSRGGEKKGEWRANPKRSELTRGSNIDEDFALTWVERAILIMVMMGGRRRRVSFRQRSNELRSLSWRETRRIRWKWATPPGKGLVFADHVTNILWHFISPGGPEMWLL